MFHIRDNPRKFALYEHTIESEHDVTIRKFNDHELPLLTCLRWTLDAAFDHDAFLALLAKKRIVLQENESGDIDVSSAQSSFLLFVSGLFSFE